MNRNYGFLSYQKIRTTSTIDCFLKVNNSSNLFLTSLNLKENNNKKLEWITWVSEILQSGL